MPKKGAKRISSRAPQGGFSMAEQYPHNQSEPQQPDVVAFSPELLKLADTHRRR